MSNNTTAVGAIREKGTFSRPDSKLVFHRRSCSRTQCIYSDQKGTREPTRDNCTATLCVLIKTSCQWTTRMKHRLRRLYQTINSLTGLFNNLTHTEHQNNKIKATLKIQPISSQNTQVNITWNSNINCRPSSSSAHRDSHQWWATAIRTWEQMLMRVFSCSRWDHQPQFK